MGLALALFAHLLVLGAWLNYLWLIPREAVPVKPIGHTTAMLVGMALAVIGALLAPGGLMMMAGGVLAMVTVAFGGLFVWLLTQAALPDGNLQARLGEPLPEFEVIDLQGQPWTPANLAGRRTLLKFYRGHW